MLGLYLGYAACAAMAVNTIYEFSKAVREPLRENALLASDHDDD